MGRRVPNIKGVRRREIDANLISYVLFLEGKKRARQRREREALKKEEQRKRDAAKKKHEDRHER